MKKVKITVLKTTLDEDFAAEYGISRLTPCPMMRVGDVFYADYAKPEGLCDEAWKAIYQYVFALAHGAENELFYFGDWIRMPGVAICNCNDGLRPVIFKLETTDHSRRLFGGCLPPAIPGRQESVKKRLTAWPAAQAELSIRGCCHSCCSCCMQEGWICGYISTLTSLPE